MTVFNLLTHRIIIVNTDSPFKNITFHVTSFCCYLGMKRMEATFFQTVLVSYLTYQKLFFQQQEELL